jgi:hypothetical protein
LSSTLTSDSHMPIDRPAMSPINIPVSSIPTVCCITRLLYFVVDFCLAGDYLYYYHVNVEGGELNELYMFKMRLEMDIPSWP